MKKLVLFWLLSGGIASLPAAELTLPQILRAASSYSPEVAAARLRDLAAEKRVAVSRAGYLPDVDLEAVDSDGFAASTGTLGVGGVMGSPYREGAAVGAVATIPIWDFGRTSNAVDVAQHEANRDREATEYQRYQTYQTALSLFYHCALYRTQADQWAQLADEARLVKNEVNRFVRTGQRSIVERFLAESQMEEAITQSTLNKQELVESIKEISVLTGLTESTIQCPELPKGTQAMDHFSGQPLGNPILRMAAESVAEARSEVSRAKSDFMPKIVATASIGTMQDQRFVQPNFYSLGAAIILPVFEGFRTRNEVDAAQASEGSQEKELEARKLQIADLNARYDRTIQTAKVALVHLRDEYQLADQGFRLAKKRYFSLQGGVVDVRESLHNLTRILTQLNETRERFLEASGAKAILDGTPFS